MFSVKQVEDYQTRLQDAAHEINKPLARYSDDQDLDNLLKQQARDGDPMLEYLRNKEQTKDAGKPCNKLANILLICELIDLCIFL